MATDRITITVPTDVLDELRKHAGPGETSAYVVEAIRAKLQRDPVLDMLAVLDDLHGTTSADDRRASARDFDRYERELGPTA